MTLLSRHVLCLISLSVDVTCGTHHLRETIFIYTTYMTVAMTPLSTLACPMSHQVVSECDMWQSRSEGGSISMYYIYDGSYDTSVNLTMSYQVVSGCDM